MKKPSRKQFIVGGVGLLIIIVVVILVIGRPLPPEALTQQLATAEREHDLSYRSLDTSSVQSLSSFEEHDNLKWQGAGFYDDREVFDGKTSLGLVSTDRQEGVTFATDLPSLNDFTHLEIGVAVTDPDDLESLTIYAGNNEQPRAYSFLFSNLLERWNILRLPREQFVASDAKEPTPWSQINRLELSLRSRPGVTIIANLDALRLERTRNYLNDWNVNVETFLGLDSYHDVVYLLVRGTGTSVATIKAIPSAKDFVYRAKLIPFSSKRTGLFFRGDYRSNYGYIFWFGGSDKNTWGLSANQGGVEDIVASGELTNVRFREGEPVWLEVQTVGENIIARLSLDGENYSELANISDSTLLDLTGGVGVYAEGGGLTLFDDFHFAQ